MRWILSENRELSFCEKELVRHHTRGNLKPITSTTLKHRMDFTVQVVEKVLTKSLPVKFGVSFDGWSEFGTHYLAVFAVGPGLPKDLPALLGFSPFEQEDDLSADQHRIYLNTLLGYHGRDESAVIYLVGDNCSTNLKLFRDMTVPLIGCHSHKLNLALKDGWVLMVVLKTIMILELTNKISMFAARKVININVKDEDNQRKSQVDGVHGLCRY
jgi:hypothetical protein